MSAKYTVALGVLNFRGGPPARPAAADGGCYYQVDDPVLAGALLGAALARGDYLDAVELIQLTGLGSRAEQRHGHPHTAQVPGDMWAAVCYPVGVMPRHPPHVVFGTHRHRVVWAAPAVLDADGVLPLTDGAPGVMSNSPARLHAATLFVNNAVAAGLNF